MASKAFARATCSARTVGVSVRAWVRRWLSAKGETAESAWAAGFEAGLATLAVVVV